MKRVESTEGIPLITCINPYSKKYRIRWDIISLGEDEEGRKKVSFYETDIINKHTLRIQDVKNAILNTINSYVENKILSGFIWNEIPVWLSTENQFNYKAAYDLTIQSGGDTLPVIFKFGSTENPVYYKFTTVEELSTFYISAMKFISDTLLEGWTMKDSIDWSVYNEYFKKK